MAKSRFPGGPQWYPQTQKVLREGGEAPLYLPENHVIGMMISIGKAATKAQARGGQLPKEEVVIQNRFEHVMAIV